jgi:acyl-CoA hydrolase
MPENTAIPRRFDDPEACVDWLLDTVGRELRVGAPLGLGKPNHLLNALYRRAKTDPSIRLKLFTALSLDTPKASGELERRLIEPLVERVFGDWPDLDYVADLKADRVPDNIEISEFFFQPGAMLGKGHAQRHYRSSNYTHVARDLLGNGVNVLMQQVAPHSDGERVSLSCNPDVTLELLPHVAARRAAGETIVMLAQYNVRLPYLGRDAEVGADTFDAVLTGYDFKPFGAPAMPASDPDYAIGLYASTLLADGGTLQIGIGALSDAIAYCADRRHNDNADYRRLADHAGITERYGSLIEAEGGLAPFERGLYGCTEMLVDAYLQLYRAGVIKRRVYPDVDLQRLIDRGRIGEAVTPDALRVLLDEGVVARELTADDVARLVRTGVFRAGVHLEAGELRGPGCPPHIGPDLTEPSNLEAVCAHCLGERLAEPTVVHGGFFLGPTAFYDGLKALPPDERDLFCMTGVNRINHLYGGETLRRAQRRKARFINTALKATLDGAVVSDGLENGQVLSGVGGQYNFVAQAHALEGARSILCVRAIRDAGGKPESNVVWRYAYATIPRHLRDIVITEYGIADLRGKTDAEVIAAMIAIADARFQDGLRAQAIAAGKLPPDWEIPERARANTPDHVAALLRQARAGGPGDDDFPRFPFGTDFTDEEIVLTRALRALAAKPRTVLIKDTLRHAATLLRPPPSAAPYLERMSLARPAGWRERALAKTVLLALACDGALS